MAPIRKIEVGRPLQVLLALPSLDGDGDGGDGRRGDGFVHGAQIGPDGAINCRDGGRRKESLVALWMGGRVAEWSGVWYSGGRVM